MNLLAGHFLRRRREMSKWYAIIPFRFGDTIFQALVGFFIEDYLCFYVYPPGVKLMTFLLLYQLRTSDRLEEKLYDYLPTNSVCVSFSFSKQSETQLMCLSHISCQNVSPASVLGQYRLY